MEIAASKWMYGRAMTCSAEHVIRCEIVNVRHVVGSLQYKINI